MSQTSTSEAQATVVRLNPPTMWDMTTAGFSQISVAPSGHLAFLSGQIATGSDENLMPTNLAEQARLATVSIAAALTELGASAQDIVMLRVYVVDATTDAFQEVLAELRYLLQDHMPSVTTIGVQALHTPALRVEIEVIASVAQRLEAKLERRPTRAPRERSTPSVV